jgi:hypothetical protein
MIILDKVVDCLLNSVLITGVIHDFKQSIPYSVIFQTRQSVLKNEIVVPIAYEPQSNVRYAMADGTVIISNSSDDSIIRKWVSSDVKYLLTVDRCQFPEFNSIAFLDIPRYSMEIPNAGGSSNKSEALSMQFMHYRFGATDFIPEMDVDYWIDYKMCDYLMSLHGENIGVSVTRAIAHPFDSPYTYDMALNLLDKKLYGLIVARNCISERHQFFRAILHIWCMHQQTATSLQQAYQEMVRRDTTKTYDNVYVMCTICSHKYIYTNWLGTKP